MSDKTNVYWWLPWAIVVAVVAAFSVMSSYYTNWYFLAPWTPARIVVTEMAISKFESGVASAAPHWDMRLIALGSILATFIVGPSLWVYGELKSEHKDDGALKKGLVWYLGAVLIVIGLEVVPVSFTKAVAFQNTWGMADQHRENDRLRTELLKLGFDAVETYHRPRKQGGGGGSFQLATAGNNLRPIQLSDLDAYPVGKTMRFELQDSTNADSTITIYAISDKDGPDPDYRNADGRSGKVEIAVTVRPSAAFDFKQMNAR